VYYHVIDIDGPSFNINKFNFNNNDVAPSNVAVIFNVKGTSITFGNWDFQVLDGYGHKVLWNMPEVTTLKLNNAIIHGSILAPKAFVESEESIIQGQLICKGYSGPAKFDWVKFEGCLPEYHELNDIPITTSLPTTTITPSEIVETIKTTIEKEPSPTPDNEKKPNGSPVYTITGIAVGSAALIVGSTMLMKHRRAFQQQIDPFNDPTTGLNNGNP